MLNLALIAAVLAAVHTSDSTPTAASAAVTPTAVATPISAEAMARDPRMIAAIRHANATADRKCGEGVGGNVDLATKAEAARCRRRMIATAKLDAESEISGH